MKRQEIINNKKICSDCHKWKDISEFYSSKIAFTGLTYVCKDCSKEKQKKFRDEAGSEWKQKISLNHKFRSYGLTSEQIAALPKECEICQETEDLHIDHNHSTGDVRGILCSGCNRGIGMFQENIDSITAAITYLETPPTRRLFSRPVFVQRERY